MVVVLVLFSSCVPNEKLVYLQDKSVGASEDEMGEYSVLNRPPDYALRKGDVLSVNINHVSLGEISVQESSNQGDIGQNRVVHPYLQGYSINDNGEVQLPLIGTLKAEGLTLGEFKAKVLAKAEESYSSPTVRIYMLNYLVTILGEVNQPGRYPVYTESINVLDIIGLAGGLAEYADREKVKIIKSGPDGKYSLHYLDLTDRRTLSMDEFYLRPGDAVVVKPLKQKQYNSRSLQISISAVTALIALAGLIISANR